MCRTCEHEFPDRFSEVALADGPRGDDEKERLRAEFRRDDLAVAARDGNRPGAWTAERLDDRVHGCQHGRRHHADDVQPDSISSPGGQDRSGPSQEQDCVETAFRVDRGQERQGGISQRG